MRAHRMPGATSTTAPGAGGFRKGKVRLCSARRARIAQLTLDSAPRRREAPPGAPSWRPSIGRSADEGKVFLPTTLAPPAQQVCSRRRGSKLDTRPSCGARLAARCDRGRMAQRTALARARRRPRDVDKPRNAAGCGGPCARRGTQARRAAAPPRTDRRVNRRSARRWAPACGPLTLSARAPMCCGRGGVA
jgi:hypothetical protein